MATMLRIAAVEATTPFSLSGQEKQPRGYFGS
jgi:hypothetical protein